MWSHKKKLFCPCCSRVSHSARQVSQRPRCKMSDILSHRCAHCLNSSKLSFLSVLHLCQSMMFFTFFSQFVFFFHSFLFFMKPENHTQFSSLFSCDVHCEGVVFGVLVPNCTLQFSMFESPIQIKRVFFQVVLTFLIKCFFFLICTNEHFVILILLVLFFSLSFK